MSDPLVTYVNDHLGGARLAVELLEAMRDQHDDKNFRDLATVLLLAIQADDHTLRAIAEKIGTGPSAIKEVGGWIVEKAARLKLGHTGSTDFAMFESLELLAIGIHGKLCLCKALQWLRGRTLVCMGSILKRLLAAPNSSTTASRGIDSTLPKPF